MKLKDADIREPLFDYLEDTFGKIRIIEEKIIGKSRADVLLVLDDMLCGIEIKSDTDTYARLSSQVKDYDKYYDCNYVAIGTSHVVHINEHIPDYWGIITVELIDGKPDFYILRKASPNPKVNWKRKLEILWRPELAIIQEWNNMPKYKEKSKLFVRNKIIEYLDIGKINENDLKHQVSQLLFERDYNNISSQIQEYRNQNTSIRERQL